jgi:hypothetical protein
MSESTFNDSSVGTVGSRVVAYSRQYKRTNERKGTSYSTRFAFTYAGIYSKKAFSVP